MQSFVCGTRLCFGADAPAALAGLHAERVLLVTDPYFAENGTAARYAAAFGLGEHTGIELPESTGQMATEAVKKKLENTNWYVGDSLQAAIGQ